jgi:acetylornithine deacetylase/succinyl-diaminopimelate desuccinylase-like protein
MADWQQHLVQSRERSLEELKELLRIPSLSALPAHKPDVNRAALWVADRLRRAGLQGVQVIATSGHPVVYAEWLHAPGRCTALIYGHFDVQPADPLELWKTPPFEPEVRDERIYARGASDMKANLLISILAVESLLRTNGQLPVNVKFLLEGQEEIGSPQLPAVVAARRPMLACDLVLSADGGQWSLDQPALLIGLRGGCGLQINVRGPATDLHSGLFGGMVHNPLHALVRILDSMRSADGKILVEGFYDDIVPLSAVERGHLAAVPFELTDFHRATGAPEPFGETGYSPLERTWARPTLEINGLWGGFQGEGVKTIIPSEAHAKITCRLVPNQKPERILQLLTAHIKKQEPRGVTVDVQPFGFAARPYLIPADHWGNQTAAAVLREEYGKDPLYIRMGGSVPICEILREHLGADTVTFGFGQMDEQFHAPNEFFRLKNFERGTRAWAKLLLRLGAMKPASV